MPTRFTGGMSVAPGMSFIPGIGLLNQDEVRRLSPDQLTGGMSLAPGTPVSVTPGGQFAGFLPQSSPQVSGATSVGTQPSTAGTATAPTPSSSPAPAPQVLGAEFGSGREADRAASESFAQEEAMRRMASVNEAFGGLEDIFSKREQQLRGIMPEVLGGLESSFGVERDIVDSAREQALRQAEIERGRITEEGQAMTEEQRRQERDAITGARRLAQELGTRIQQMLGGRSSSSELAQTLLGRELGRQIGGAQETAGMNIADIQRQQSQQMRQVQERQEQIRENAANQLRQVEAQMRNALNQTRMEFEDRISQIDQSRAMAESQKASEKLNELRDLRSRQQQLLDQGDQLRQQVSLQAQSALQSLQQGVAAFQIESGRPIDFSQIEQAQARGFGTPQLPAVGLGFRPDPLTPTLTGQRRREEE